MTLLKIESRPQIINENIIEKIATKIVKLIPSLKLGQLTKFFSSLYESLKYLTISDILIIFCTG